MNVTQETNNTDDKGRYLIVAEYVRPNGVRREHRVYVNDELYEFYKDKPVSYEMIRGVENALYCNVRACVANSDEDWPAEYTAISSFTSLTQVQLAWLRLYVEDYITKCNEA